MRSFDIAAVLNREGIEFVTRADGKLRIRCPFHDASPPSCDGSQDNQQFICRSCQAHGGIVALLCKLLGKPRHLVLATLATSTDRPVEASVVSRYHERIWSATSLLTELRKRGVTDATIRKYFLGEHQGRVTIPVANHAGMFVNIRSYLPGADEYKTINLKGRSVSRLYPFDQLAYDQILLTGGEIKALVGAQVLNDHGIGCVTLTSGETQWNEQFDAYFEGKRVWIGLDIDEPGRKAAEFRCARLSTLAEWIGRVDWPLDIKKHPHGDLNDFVAEGGDLLALLEATPQWEKQAPTAATSVADEVPLEVSIRKAYSAEMVDHRFKSSALVIANGQGAYFIPKRVVPKCDQRQDALCSSCPVFGTTPGYEMTIHPEHDGILSMLDADKARVTEHVREALEIPDCPVVQFDIKEKYEVRELRVQQAIDLSKQDLDHEAVPVITVGTEVDLNENYWLTGKTVSHPKTQKGIAIVSDAKQCVDALRTYTLTQPEDLLRFRPIEWAVDGIDALLTPYYKELAASATMIYERTALPQLVDLAYHSVLSMPLGANVQRGWVEVLITGDSGQGKSLAVQRMAEFYGLGEKVDCKNATVAGLIGGLEKIADKFFVQWGVFPRHDRRLLILEELKGMRADVFAKLTETRSSGKAELPKIIRRIAPARARLVVNSNPRSSNYLDAYSYGVYAIQELIGAPEDIRRFDACMIVSKEQISGKVVNEARPRVEPTFTADQCRRLILWCWTRTTEQIQVMPTTEDKATQLANQLCEKYVDDIPILDRAGTKFKLLRLAAALAGRTFSATEDYTTLIVRPSHVEWVARFLDTEYSRPENGYATLSSSIKKKAKLLEPELLKSAISALPHAEVVIDRMLASDEIDRQDICDWCGWSNDEADLLISRLVRSNAMKRANKMYRKTPPFTELLRGIKIEARPAHVGAPVEY